MDRLHAMKVLVDVAEAGSLSAAARKLGLPLATLSRRVAELEAHLGVRLFNRTSRRLELTEAARLYLPAVRRILEDVAEAERTAKGEYASPRGDLIVAAPLVFGRLHVLPIVVDFLAVFPQIDVRLVLNDRNANLVEDQTSTLRCASAICPTAGSPRQKSVLSAASSAPALPISRGVAARKRRPSSAAMIA